MLAARALKDKSIHCISQMIAPRMVRLHAHQMFVNIDFLLTLPIVGEDLQGDCIPSAMFL